MGSPRIRTHALQPLRKIVGSFRRSSGPGSFAAVLDAEVVPGCLPTIDGDFDVLVCGHCEPKDESLTERPKRRRCTSCEGSLEPVGPHASRERSRG